MTRRKSRRDERGLAAILISISMVALLVIAGMIIDFGFVRYERQINKSVADSAVAAGMRSFDQQDGQVYTFQGVCDAIGYLKTNEPKLATLPAFTVGAVNACSNAPILARTCTPTNTLTHATYTGTTADGRYTVTVKSPYSLPDAAFPEDAYTGVAADNGDQCLQLGIIIAEAHRTSGPASLAYAGSFTSTIRSVGRVQGGPGTRSPALLLLDRHECLVLTTGTNSSSVNQDNFIRVFGAQAGAAVQPGTIHADSDGSACGTNETIYQGKRLDGIVAYAAPDLSQNGIISSYAARLGVAPAILSDGVDRTYGSNRATYASAATGTKYPVAPLGLITRKIVDDRYLEPLRGAVQSAESLFAWLSSASVAAANGWTVYSNCNGTQGDLNGLGSAENVYVDCATYRGTGSFHNARKIMFAGAITQQASVEMPKAVEVYVRGSSSGAITSTGNPFRMHHNGASACPDSVQTESAKLFVRTGGIANNNGFFQACNTAVVMMSGSSTACLPSTGTVAPPTTQPCGANTPGSGTLDLGGGGSGSTKIDWSAPNKHDADMTVLTPAQKQAAWNQLEDLAFWSETYSSTSFKMSGGSNLDMTGVFMTPNADPFTVTGGGAQMLVNAQYIATKFEVNGGASLNMVVDPNNTVTLPRLTYFDLVR